MTLDDAELVRREYADEQSFLRRNLHASAIYEGPDPREHALLALHERHPQRFLDVGCGTGEFAERAARVLGCDVVGLDQSERMVELACARGVNAVVGDAHELPFSSGSFDAASANWMLYHIADLDRALRELARVLHPTGRLVAIVNDAEHLSELWGSDESEFARRCELALGQQFRSVERRDVRGAGTFASVEALREYLSGFETLHGRDETSRLHTHSMPLRVTCHNIVLVADDPALSYRVAATGSRAT